MLQSTHIFPVYCLITRQAFFDDAYKGERIRWPNGTSAGTANRPRGYPISDEGLRKSNKVYWVPATRALSWARQVAPQYASLIVAMHNFQPAADAEIASMESDLLKLRQYRDLSRMSAIGLRTFREGQTVLHSAIPTSRDRLGVSDIPLSVQVESLMPAI